MLKASSLVVHETIGGTAVAWVAVVAASTYYQKIAGGLAIGCLTIPVSTPFPYVSSHVV